MRPFVLYSVYALLGASSVLAAIPLSSVRERAEDAARTVPNRFIIEVDTLANIPNKRAYARTIDAVYDSIRSRAVEFEVDKEFDSEGLFVGAAVTITTPADAAELDGIPGLKAIYPVRRVDRPEPENPHVITGPGDPAIIPSTLSTHVATGVDKVHARGVYGNGIKIGIIDSGIDYMHPQLGGGFGPGFKVVGGYDLVGDDYTGRNTPVPDPDPLDQCQGHGTFVAGVLGANPDNQYNISGVAYQASLTAYRIFGCRGSATDDVVVEALLRAAADDVDILNLSLGGANGWTSGPVAVIASRIARRGKIVVIAAGNDGLSGSWYASTPSSAIGAISVGSVENTIIPVAAAIVSGADHSPIPYSTFTPLNIPEERPIYALTEDTSIPDDACNPLPDDTPDLSPYVVIIRRGTCTFVQKVDNLRAKGAQAALVYDNGGTFTPIPIPGFPVALIPAADGQFLVESFFAGVDVRLSFPADEVAGFPNPRGGLMAQSSTYGPTNDFHFKPAVAAPGANVLSLLPVALGSFAVQGGTSFASPFVAGAAALLLQVKGKTAATSRAAKDLFETNAVRVLSASDEGSLPQTLTQQGAGLVNVFETLYSKTIVSPGELILNDTANFKRRHTFTVRNTDNRAKVYSLSHVPAGTALTVRQDSIHPSLGPVPQANAPAGVILTPARFTLRPGQSRTVTAIFSPPSGVDPSRYPVYSGFIQISSPGENHHVSYLGLLGSLRDKQVVDNTDYFFGERIPVLIDAFGNSQTGPVNYTFQRGDWPAMIDRLVFGSPLVRLDLVDPDIEVPTTLNARAPQRGGGHSFTFPQRNRGGSFGRVKIVGPLWEFDYVSRNNEDPETNAYNLFDFAEPVFANGTTIPNGSYRLLYRILKVTGNRSRQEDYETWLSPVIGIFA